MNCPNCGTLLPENAKFCGVCGTQLSTGADAEATQPQETQPIEPAELAQEPALNGQPAAPAEATNPMQPAAPAEAYNPYGTTQDQYAQAAQQTPPMQQMPPQQMPPNPGQFAGVYTDASGAAAKTGLSKGVIGAIIAAVVVAIALIVVFVVVKPFNTPEKSYADTFNKIAADGAFTEEISFDMNVDIPGYYSTSTSMSMDMTLDIQNYDENDPSKMTATGSGYFELPDMVSGRIPFDVEIKNGKMTMDMGYYGSQTESITPDDIVTNAEAYEDLWDKAQVDGNVITFDLSDAEMKELIASGAAGSASDLSELENFTFDTMKYTITLDNDKITTDIVLKGSYEEYGTTANMDMTMSMVIK